MINPLNAHADRMLAQAEGEPTPRSSGTGAGLKCSFDVDVQQLDKTLPNNWASGSMDVERASTRWPWPRENLTLTGRTRGTSSCPACS